MPGSRGPILVGSVSRVAGGAGLAWQAGVPRSYGSPRPAMRAHAALGERSASTPWRRWRRSFCCGVAACAPKVVPMGVLCRHPWRGTWRLVRASHGVAQRVCRERKLPVMERLDQFFRRSRWLSPPRPHLLERGQSAQLVQAQLIVDEAIGMLDLDVERISRSCGKSSRLKVTIASACPAMATASTWRSCGSGRLREGTATRTR